MGTKSSDHLKCALIDLHAPITDNAHHDLLPTLLAPRPRTIPGAQMRNVLHDSMHRPAEQVVLFVVHGHDYKQLRSSRGLVEDLAERETVILKFIGIASCGRIAHMRKFAIVLKLAAVEQFLRDLSVEDEVTMRKPASKVHGQESLEM